MKLALHAPFAVILLAGGALAGRALFTGADEPASVPESGGREMASHRPSRSLRAAGEMAAKKHDLATLTALHREDPEGKSGLTSALERLDGPALRRFLLEQREAAGAEGLSAEEKEAQLLLLDAAVEELHRRDGVAALEWAASLEKEQERKSMMRRLLVHAFADDPDAALPWMEKYNSANQSWETDMMFMSSAVTGAVKRGADEVIRIHGKFRDVNHGNPLREADYPENFDFAKLYAGLGTKTDLSGAISRWTMRDREAAWNTVVADVPADRERNAYQRANSLDGIVSAVIAMDGEQAGAEWLVERLAGLPDGKRKLYLESIGDGGRLSVEGSVAIASSLPPEDRLQYVSFVAKSDEGAPRALALIDTLQREEAVAVLKGSFRPFGPDTRDPSYEIRADNLMREITTRYNLTAEESTEIRGAILKGDDIKFSLPDDE
jgi:hypothetical protein